MAKNVADIFLKDDNKSPLGVLGISGSNQENLLDEALSGNLDNPGNASGLIGKRTLGFDDAAREIKANFLGNPLEKEVAQAEKEEEDPLEEEKEVPLEDEKTEEEIQEAAKNEDEVPEYFHTLNRRAELAEQRSEQTERNMQAYLQRLEQRLPSAQVPQEQIPYEQFGFENPEQYTNLRDQIKKETLAELQRANLPVLQQLVADKFNATVAHMEAQHKHWKEYFPSDYVKGIYQQISQNYPVDYLAKVDWSSELTSAYKVKDYDRVSKAYEASQQKKEVETKIKQDKKQEEKAQQKSNLKLVPKASQKGDTNTKMAEEEQDIFQRKPSSRGFDALSQSFKQRLLAK